jgi:hypothetical protein
VPPRDDPAGDEVEHAVREHLRVDPEVLVPTQHRESRVGDGADAHLQRGPVLDERGHVAPDGALDVGEYRWLVLRQRLLLLHGVVYLVHRDEPIPVRARHLGVDLGYHHAGGADGGLAGGHRDPSEQKPCRSGGETLTRATSSGSTRERNSRGTSLRKTGT